MHWCPEETALLLSGLGVIGFLRVHIRNWTTRALTWIRARRN